MIERSCMAHIPVCPRYRNDPDVPTEQCGAPARCTLEIPCGCPDGSHTIWVCPEHYDWWMELVQMAKDTWGTAAMLLKGEK